MEGLKRLVGISRHRKELVAGGLAEKLTAGMSDSFSISTAAPTIL
jgi:hypothetical protein